MRHHICGATTARAERLQILNSILGTPRKMLWQYSDGELLEVEDEAYAIGRQLEEENRCTHCGGQGFSDYSVRDRMDRSLAELWGAL